MKLGIWKLKWNIKADTYGNLELDFETEPIFILATKHKMNKIALAKDQCGFPAEKQKKIQLSELQENEQLNSWRPSRLWMLLKQTNPIWHW